MNPHTTDEKTEAGRVDSLHGDSGLEVTINNPGPYTETQPGWPGAEERCGSWAGSEGVAERERGTAAAEAENDQTQACPGTAAGQPGPLLGCSPWLCSGAGHFVPRRGSSLLCPVLLSQPGSTVLAPSLSDVGGDESS